MERTVLSVEQAEGVGARVRRSIGRKEVSISQLILIHWGPFFYKKNPIILTAEIPLYTLFPAEKP